MKEVKESSTKFNVGMKLFWRVDAILWNSRKKPSNKDAFFAVIHVISQREFLVIVSVKIFCARPVDWSSSLLLFGSIGVC